MDAVSGNLEILFLKLSGHVVVEPKRKLGSVIWGGSASSPEGIEIGYRKSYFLLSCKFSFLLSYKYTVYNY